jgi:hypothetical protein
MIKRYNQFIKENLSIVSDDEIIDFLDKLDKISKYYDETSVEGSSSDLRWDHKDNLIIINYGWSTYEEGSSETITIDLTSLEVTHIEDTSSVYGDYKNEDKRKFSSLEEIYSKYFGYSNINESLKSPHQMMVGSQYKITEPDYDDEGFDTDVVEVMSKNKSGFILKNIDHGFTYERTFQHLMTCVIEEI